MRSKTGLVISGAIMLLMVMSTTSVAQAQGGDDFEYKVGQSGLFWIHENSRWIHGDVLVGNNTDGDYFVLNHLASVHHREAMTVGAQVVEANDTHAMAYARGRVSRVNAYQYMRGYYQTAEFYPNVSLNERHEYRDWGVSRNTTQFAGYVDLPFGRYMPVIGENSTHWNQWGSITWTGPDGVSHTLLIYTAVRNHHSFTYVPINDSNGDFIGYGYVTHAYTAVAFVLPESGKVVRFEEYYRLGFGNWCPRYPARSFLLPVVPDETWDLPEEMGNITYFGAFFDSFTYHRVATMRLRGVIDTDMGDENIVPPAAMVGEDEFAPEDEEDIDLIDEDVPCPEINEDEMTDIFTTTEEEVEDSVDDSAAARDAALPFDAGAMIAAATVLAFAALGMRRRN